MPVFLFPVVNVEAERVAARLSEDSLYNESLRAGSHEW
jgi:hypothetical protein